MTSLDPLQTRKLTRKWSFTLRSERDPCLLVSHLSQVIILALNLIYEKSLKEASHWHAYIEELGILTSGSFDTTYFWNEEELEKLRGSELLEVSLYLNCEEA